MQQQDAAGATPQALTQAETIPFLTEIEGERAAPPRKYGAHKRLEEAGRISPEAEAEAEVYCEMYEAFHGGRNGPGSPDKTRIIHRGVMAAGWLRLADAKLKPLGTQLVVAACVLCRPMRLVGELMPGAPPPMPSRAGLTDADYVFALAAHSMLLAKFRRRQAERAETELVRALRRLANEEG